ncbi:MAG: hypothetical protein AAF458_23570 [Pseudomonadota bacterium]
MKILRQRAGVLDGKPVWVCIADGVCLARASSLRGLLNKLDPDWSKRKGALIDLERLAA